MVQKAKSEDDHLRQEKAKEKARAKEGVAQQAPKKVVSFAGLRTIGRESALRQGNTRHRIGQILQRIQLHRLKGRQVFRVTITVPGKAQR